MPPGAPDELVRLVKRATAGDAAAQRALFEAHRGAAWRVARAFGELDPDDCDDVVQETFVRAFRGLARLEDGSRFGAWVLSIARNRALTRLARRRAAQVLSEELGREGEALDAAVAPEPPDPGANAEIELVRRLIAELPDGPEKDTVHLFYVEGKLSAREIAEKLGVGKSAVTMRLERFRAKVKRRLLAEVARARGEGS